MVFSNCYGRSASAYELRIHCWLVMVCVCILLLWHLECQCVLTQFDPHFFPVRVCMCGSVDAPWPTQIQNAFITPPSYLFCSWFHNTTDKLIERKFNFTATTFRWCTFFSLSCFVRLFVIKSIIERKLWALQLRCSYFYLSLLRLFHCICIAVCILDILDIDE